MHLPASGSHPGHVRKLPVAWGKAVVFTGYSGFLHQLQLASHNLAAIWQKKSRKAKFQIQNPVSGLSLLAVRYVSSMAESHWVL